MCGDIADTSLFSTFCFGWGLGWLCRRCRLCRRDVNLCHWRLRKAATRRSSAAGGASAATWATNGWDGSRPTRLWQMDFKGHFALTETPLRCHPLTVIDDHSRFAVTLSACDNERT